MNVSSLGNNNMIQSSIKELSNTETSVLFKMGDFLKK